MSWNPFRREAKPKDVESALAELEQKAASASSGYGAQFLARAGDLCAESGDRKRTLAYWGRAIDEYLNTARPRAAAALCRKIIGVAPEVVRARRTLALLAIGEGHTSEALEQVEAYARAAIAAGSTELVIKQLRLMGEATWSGRFRRLIASLLRELGDIGGAEYVARVLPDQASGDEAIPDEAHDRWSMILRVALMPPEEVRRSL